MRPLAGLTAISIMVRAAVSMPSPLARTSSIFSIFFSSLTSGPASPVLMARMDADRGSDTSRSPSGPNAKRPIDFRPGSPFCGFLKNRDAESAACKVEQVNMRANENAIIERIE